MHVGIIKTREEKFTGGVDHPSVRTAEGFDFGIGPDRHDPLPQHGYGLRGRPGLIDCPDLRVNHDQIGRRLGLGKD
jgi:hypothetical protein